MDTPTPAPTPTPASAAPDRAAPPRPPAPGSPPGSAEPPSIADVGWFAGIAVLKATIIALAIDAFLNSGSPRFSGKAMRIRAIGYVGALGIVPALWRLRGRHEPYPKELDLLVALPLLADAGGNAIGIYQRAHVDDAIHFAHGALLTSVVGSVVTPRMRTPWEAAAAAAAIGTSAAALWEVMEWTASKFGAKGMDLSYDDTMADLVETIGGAVLGGAITLLRHPARLREVPGRAGDPIVARHGPAPSPAADR